MDVFATGLIVLFLMAAIFYVVFFSFIYYWHLKKITYVVIPMVFAFEFLVIGFLVVALVSIILQYVPELIKLSA